MLSHVMRDVGSEGQGRPSFFYITCGLSHRVSITKLVELDRDVYPYLAALMVAALAWAGEILACEKAHRP